MQYALEVALRRQVVSALPDNEAASLWQAALAEAQSAMTRQPSGAFSASLTTWSMFAAIPARPVYPLVITGGGALPLPISYCAQPAMLKRASTAAIARASFFIEVTFVLLQLI